MTKREEYNSLVPGDMLLCTRWDGNFFTAGSTYKVKIVDSKAGVVSLIYVKSNLTRSLTITPSEYEDHFTPCPKGGYWR